MAVHKMFMQHKVRGGPVHIPEAQGELKAPIMIGSAGSQSLIIRSAENTRTMQF